MRRSSVLVLALLAIAGCGGDDEAKTTTETVTQTDTVTTPETQTQTNDATGGEAKVELADAERSARRESSRQLENQAGGFTVAEGDWQVDCSGGESGGPWTCKVDQGGQGPCSGTATVTPRADGLTVTTAKVGCIAD